ncbi:MAG: HDIG domain-containing protein [Ignavibacteriae bacterium]|nr:HDIG domain-containing protein [Ignavibacteriota bacterium]
MKLIFRKIQNKLEGNKDDVKLNENILIKVFIGLITLVSISLFLPNYKSIETDIEVGTVWSSEDLIAPFSFPIYRDENEFNKEKKEVESSVPPVFSAVEINIQEIRDSLNAFFTSVEGLFSKSINLEKGSDSGIISEKLAADRDATGLQLSPDFWVKFQKFYRNDYKTANSITYQSFKNSVKQNIIDFSNDKIINLEKSRIGIREITVKANKEKLFGIETLDKVYDKPQILTEARGKFNQVFRDSVLTDIAYQIANIYVKENLIFNKELTDLEIQNRIEQIPKTIGIVRENERIVSKHDPITNFTKLKLDSYKKVRLENVGVQDYFKQVVGKVMTIFILLLILSFFLYYIRFDIYNNNLKLALLSSLLILVSFISFLSLKLTINAPVELLIFVSVASILLTIIFDSRLAFFAIVIVCLLIAAIRGGDFTVVFVSFCGSVLAIFSVRDIKNRSQIFRSFFFILAGYTIAILAVGFDRFENLQKVTVNLLYGGINAIMSPIIAYGLLIFYEKVFKITTDLTLLELADFNQPLLKELSTKAPGTFHHSIVMGNLAEEAAASIKANRILARVGCYYHDIGKTAQPSFFVENQIEKYNRHETLNPNLSAKIIISHVKEGIELARRNKLPQEIIDFIPMHHGTTLVKYFYSKAKSLVNEDKEDFSEYIFRYPGPKPQTKETGIAMLADTVEASTKAIEDPSPKKLEEKIDEVIKSRFMEGELDECDLTLKDLTLIKKSFLKILIGIHHQRIKYPEDIKNQE